MSDNKPPRTLYFRENVSNVYMDGSHMDNRFGQAFATRKRESDVGPYVHLEQFMEEVERRAVKLFAKSFHTATLSECVSQSLKELAKEIEERKS